MDWDDVAGADDYLVRWRLHGPGQNLNDGGRHTSSSANITVAGYGDWAVQAQACNNGGCSSLTALHFKVVPAAPTGLTATPESGRISLTRTDPSDSTITKYQYRVSDDGGTSWGQDWTDVSGSGASTTSHTVTGLTNATAYTFELRAVGGTTNGASATATPAATLPDVTSVAVTSTPTSGDTQGLGETIQVTLIFSEAVDVTGTPHLNIDMDPAHWGTKRAACQGGSGTASLNFVHRVVQPNISTQGIAVLRTRWS